MLKDSEIAEHAIVCWEALRPNDYLLHKILKCYRSSTSTPVGRSLRGIQLVSVYYKEFSLSIGLKC